MREDLVAVERGENALRTAGPPGQWLLFSRVLSGVAARDNPAGQWLRGAGLGPAAPIPTVLALEGDLNHWQARDHPP